MREMKMAKIDREKELDEFERMVSKHIDEIIKHADQNKLDRDETITHYAKVMTAAAEFATFKHYKIEEENEND